MSTPSSALTRRRFLEAMGVGVTSLAVIGCTGGRTAEQGTAVGGDDEDSVAGKRIRVAAFKNNHAAAPLFWPQFAPEASTSR